MNQPWRASAVLTLITRPGCHLCDTARPIATAAAAAAGVSFDEVGIDEHPDLLAAYAEMIPVTLIDGRVHDYWRLDAARLAAALSARG